MTSFASLLLAVFTFLSSVFSSFVPTGKPQSPTDGFVPVMRFVATSDTHVTYFGDKACMRIAKMMNSAYDIAESDQDYKNVDAFVFSGDLTDNGRPTQFAAFAAVTSANLRAQTKRMAVVAKAHDSSTLGKGSLEMYTALTGQSTDFHEVINGYHFIGLSTSSGDEHYSQAQLDWLDAQLAEAVRDKPLQPVFVFQHEHIKDTVFGSYDVDGWGVDYFTSILNKYPQVVDISGHSHYPANDPKAIWQGVFTAINDGGMAYYEFTVDDENSVHPDGSNKMAQALVVEVDADNRVLVRVYDVTAERFVYEFLVDNITSPVKVKYSHLVRAAAAKAPVFAAGSAISQSSFAGYNCFTVPQATVAEDDIVYLYRLKITDADNNVVASAWELSQYYFADVPDTISFKNIKLSKGSYTVEITAEDAWGLKSAPLTLSLTV